MSLHFLANVPPDRTLVFLALLLAGVVAAFQAGRRGALSEALLPCAAVLGAAATLLPASWGLPLLVVSGVLAWRALSTKASGQTPTPPVSIWVCLIPLGLTAAALVYRLGSFSQDLLTWEGTTIDGLAEDLESGRSMLSLALSKTFWHPAPVSAGDDSLLFGLPALLLLKSCSSSIISLRAVSVVSFLLAGALLARFAGRTFGGIVGLATVAILCFCEPSLLYARYGSSVAATLCALVAAFVLCYRLSASPRYSLAILAPCTLFLATLGYSPARIPVVLLTIITPVSLLAARHVSWPKRCGTAALFSAIIAAVLAYQGANGRLRFYFDGRGEQFFGMTQTGWFPPSISNLRSLSNGPANQLTPGEKIGVAIELMRQVTSKQLSNIISPFARPESANDGPIRIQSDPPSWPVLPGVLAPFAMIGFLALMRRGTPWLRTVLAAWPLVTCAALLLTNRIDTHRAYFLIVPLSLCAAVGLDAVYQALRRLMPASLVAGAAVLATTWLAILPRQDFLYPQLSKERPITADFITLSERIPGSLLFVADLPTKQSSLIRLKLFEQHASTGEQRRFLPDYMSPLLGSGFVSTRKSELAGIQSTLDDGGTFVASPAATFFKLASFLVKDGAEARVLREGNRDFVVISKRPSAAVQQLAPVAQLPEPPAPPPVQLVGKRTIPLSSLRPLWVEAPIAKPKLNLSIGNHTLQIGGAEFSSGIGLQAPTKVDLAVPAGTLGLRALVGIDDESIDCGKSSASVAVFGQDHQAIYESPVLRAGDPPQEISLSLPHEKKITIEVSDAGDGDDCDHVDLANAVWVLDPAAPPATTQSASCVCPESP